jgi:hypothetical protein
MIHAAFNPCWSVHVSQILTSGMQPVHRPEWMMKSQEPASYWPRLRFGEAVIQNPSQRTNDWSSLHFLEACNSLMARVMAGTITFEPTTDRSWNVGGRFPLPLWIFDSAANIPIKPIEGSDLMIWLIWGSICYLISCLPSYQTNRWVHLSEAIATLKATSKGPFIVVDRILVNALSEAIAAAYSYREK